MASLLPTTKIMFLGDDGLPLVGGKIFTFDSGTTTPRVTYSDAGGTTPNTNPVILDSRGEALIFWSGSYRVRLEDALGNVIWTVDSVSESSIPYRTSSSGSIITPVGSTAQRDSSPQLGYFRYNGTTDAPEMYLGTGWETIRSDDGTALGGRDAIEATPRLAASATLAAAATLDMTLTANREVVQYNITGSAVITAMTIAAGQLVQLTFTESQNTLGAAFRADGSSTIVPRGSIVTVFASVANTPRLVKVEYSESNRILDSEFSLSGLFSTTRPLPPAHRGFRLSFRGLSGSGANGFAFRARDNGSMVGTYFYGGTTGAGGPGSTFILGTAAATDIFNGYLECYPTGSGNWFVESCLQLEGFTTAAIRTAGRFFIGTSFDGYEISARSGDTFDGTSVMTVNLL